jgi:hypothetical protein
MSTSAFTAYTCMHYVKHVGPVQSCPNWFPVPAKPGVTLQAWGLRAFLLVQLNSAWHNTPSGLGAVFCCRQEVEQLTTLSLRGDATLQEYVSSLKV